MNKNSKFEYRDPKWFDFAHHPEPVEGQIINSKFQMFKKLLKKLHLLTSWLLLILIITFGWQGRALAASGDGLLTYGSSTSTYSFNRAWTAGAPGAWGGQTGGPSITCATGVPTINWEVLKADPSTPDRYLLGVMYTCAGLPTYNTAFYNYSGGAWTSEFSVSTVVGQQTYRGMDIEFERSSGNVVVAYEKSASTTTYYYREGSWNGVNYGLNGAAEGSGTFTNTIGDHRWYILAPKLNTDEMILTAVGASGTTRNIVARVWDGSTFGTESPDLGLVYINTNWDFDCAYETNSGDGMVAWGFSGTPYWKYVTYSGGSWGAVSNGNTTGITGSGIRVLDLDANPNPDATYGDYIVAGLFEDNTTDDANGAVWNGADWSTVGNTALDNAVYSTATGRQIAVKYASDTNDAIIVFDDAATADTDYARSIDGAAFGAVTSTATAGGQDSNIQLINESTDDKIMFMREDGTNSDLYAYEYDMSDAAWTATNGGAALNATLTNGTTGEPYMFAYNTPYKVPTLGEILFLALVGCAIFIGVRSGVIKLKLPASPDKEKLPPPNKPVSNNHLNSPSQEQQEPCHPKPWRRVRSIDGLSPSVHGEFTASRSKQAKDKT